MVINTSRHEHGINLLHTFRWKFALHTKSCWWSHRNLLEQRKFYKNRSHYGATVHENCEINKHCMQIPLSIVIWELKSEWWTK